MKTNFIVLQVHRASLCALDAGTFYSILLEPPLYAVLFAMPWLLCRLLVCIHFRSWNKFDVISTINLAKPKCNKIHVSLWAGTEMAQLVCGGCHTLLMYIRGATSVQCSCCHTVNLALEGINWITERYNVFFLSLNQSNGHKNQMCICDSKSGCTCELWKLQDAVNVSIWSKICQMCGMQFCDIRWGEYN